MNINATLIVQGVNFFIAYLLLRVLLFKPAVKLIMEERAQRAALLAAIDSRVASITSKEQEMRKRWAAYQSQFKAKTPTPDSFYKSGEVKIPEFQPFSVSDEALNGVAKKITESLKHEVEHVRS